MSSSVAAIVGVAVAVAVVVGSLVDAVVVASAPTGEEDGSAEVDEASAGNSGCSSTRCWKALETEAWRWRRSNSACWSAGRRGGAGPREKAEVEEKRVGIEVFERLRRGRRRRRRDIVGCDGMGYCRLI